MRDLIATGQAVVPRIHTHQYALANRGRHTDRVGHAEAGKDRRETGAHQTGTPPRNPVDREKHAGEHERRPEILLQKKEPKNNRYAGENRRDVPPPRNADIPQPWARRGWWFREFAEDIDPAGEVGGEREHGEQAD